MWLFLVLVLLAAVGVGALYFRYGTVAPCGILRERERELAAALPEQAADAMLAAQHGPLAPQRCVAVLVGTDGGGR